MNQHTLSVWTTVFIPKDEATDKDHAERIAREHTEGTDIPADEWEYEVQDWDDDWKVSITSLVTVEGRAVDAARKVHDLLLGGLIAVYGYDISFYGDKD